MLKNIPLMGLLLVAYNLIAFMGGPSIADVLQATFIRATLPSEAELVIQFDHLFVLVGIVLLYVEVLKSARYSQDTIVDHALSMLVFVIFLIEFIVVEPCGTATFLILTFMALLDVIAGYTVSLSTARRDIAFGGG